VLEKNKESVLDRIVTVRLNRRLHERLLRIAAARDTKPTVLARLVIIKFLSSACEVRSDERGPPG
jgi:predicted transcriptional regulator